MNIAATVTAGIAVTETVTIGNGTADVPTGVNASLAFAQGTGSGMADLHFEQTGITLAAGASTTFTLSALVDSLTRAVAFVKVRCLTVTVTSRTAGDYLTVGDPAASLSHPWSAPFGSATGSVKVYGFLAIGAAKTDGYAVVASTTDQLKVTNSGANPITYSVGILGTSV